MPSLLDRLRERKLFQWAIAYVAAGWLIFQVVDVVADPWGLSDGVPRMVQAIVALGFPIALVLAWYHGEKGRQRVSGAELVIITALLALAGGALAVFNPLEVGEPVVVEEPTPEIDPHSIAILPFLDMSAEQDQAYMSDGVTVELSELLQKIPELRVKSRRSAFSFRERPDLTIPEIAAQLGVAHILEGSVRTAGDQIRITADLIDARTDVHLFSETYDGIRDEVFALQETIAARVVSQLRITILGEAPTLRETDPDAYALFLRARRIADNISQENYERAIPMFERVLEIDPEYAPAHLELAIAYFDQGNYAWRPGPEARAMAVVSTERALAIDPDFHYARAVLGAALFADDPAAGAAEIRSALEGDPDHPEIVMIAALTLGYLGRLDEGMPLLEYVRVQDPLYLVNLGNMAYFHLVEGRFSAANEIFGEIGALGGLVGTNEAMYALNLVLLGEAEQALSVMEANPVPPLRLAIMALANYELGRETEYAEAFRELRYAWSDPIPLLVPYIYAHVGEIDSAFEWLERVGPESFQVAFLTHLPGFDVLHDDPRWANYLTRVRLNPERFEDVVLEAEVPR